MSYSINTNGSLITPKIAKLMKKKGVKLISLYGATKEVHDHITRNPGSFESTMQGFAYLKEAGAGFTVQIIPMRDNYHQLTDMVNLAESFSPYWRWGASWLYLSADNDPKKNTEIIKQRLNATEIAQINRVHSQDEISNREEYHKRYNPKSNDYVFAACIDGRRDFHIDPYGQMSFCSFIKEPCLLYNVKEGSFKECWEKFIPSLSGIVRGGREYKENCGACELRNYCFWCPVYGYLENGSYSAKVDYLCEVAR
jgi:radical SAM protein with 4Fe4S-binding SPASM domain